MSAIVDPSRRVYISPEARPHPHAGEYGLVRPFKRSTAPDGSVMVQVELEECKHDVERCWVFIDQIRETGNE